MIVAAKLFSKLVLPKKYEEKMNHMNQQRREFLKSGAAVSAAALLSINLSAAKKWNRFNITMK